MRIKASPTMRNRRKSVLQTMPRVLAAIDVSQRLLTVSSMFCLLDGKRERVWRQTYHCLVAIALSQGSPKGGPSSSQNRSEVECRRHGRLSQRRGHMKAGIEVQKTVAWDVDVEFISITAPTSEELNLVVGVTRRCGRACSTSTKAVP